MDTSKDLVRTYLREIGRVPLLTHEQEVIYGKQVQQLAAMNEIREKLAAELNREPTRAEWAAAASWDCPRCH